MKRTASGRYIVYGGMDHPTRGEAREVGILDTASPARSGGSSCRRPAGTWSCHPVLDVFYAISFRVHPADRTTGSTGAWPGCGSTPSRSTPRTGGVVRHWAADRDVPAHINSDVTISDSRADLLHRRQPHASSSSTCETLIAGTGIIDEHPGPRRVWATAGRRRPAWSTVSDARKRIQQRAPYAESLRVSRGALVDGDLRLPALGRPDPALHRQPRPEPHHRLRLPLAGAAATAW